MESLQNFKKPLEKNSPPQFVLKHLIICPLWFSTLALKVLKHSNASSLCLRKNTQQYLKKSSIKVRNKKLYPYFVFALVYKDHYSPILEKIGSSMLHALEIPPCMLSKTTPFTHFISILDLQKTINKWRKKL